MMQQGLLSWLFKSTTNHQKFLGFQRHGLAWTKMHGLRRYFIRFFGDVGGQLSFLMSPVSYRNWFGVLVLRNGRKLGMYSPTIQQLNQTQFSLFFSPSMTHQKT